MYLYKCRSVEWIVLQFIKDTVICESARVSVYVQKICKGMHIQYSVKCVNSVIFCTSEYVQEWVNCVGSMYKNSECDVWTVSKQQFVFSYNDTLPCYDARSAIHKLYDDTCLIIVYKEVCVYVTRLTWLQMVNGSY